MSLHFYIVIRISVIYRFYLHKYLFSFCYGLSSAVSGHTFQHSTFSRLIYYIGILTHYFLLYHKFLYLNSLILNFFEKFITKITEMYPSSLLFRQKKQTNCKFSSSVYRLNYFLFLSHLQINQLYQPHLSEFQVSLLYRPFPHLTILSF